MYSIIAGGVSGVCEIVCLYPTDVLKTRSQLSKSSLSIFQISKDILKNQGIGGFYRGIFSPILAEAPKRVSKFAAKDFHGKYTNSLVISGSLAGITEALIVRRRVNAYNKL